jgi:hypothetical protein
MIRADSTLADARYRSDCPQSIPRRERRIARLVNLLGRRCRSAVQSRDDPIELLIQTETDLLQLRVNALPPKAGVDQRQRLTATSRRWGLPSPYRRP